MVETDRCKDEHFWPVTQLLSDAKNNLHEKLLASNIVKERLNHIKNQRIWAH